jgi:hypothetical protein
MMEYGLNRQHVGAVVDAIDDEEGCARNPYLPPAAGCMQPAGQREDVSDVL